MSDHNAEHDGLHEFSYGRWSGGRRTVRATRVTFEATGHVAFWDADLLVLAERQEQVNELRQETLSERCPECRVHRNANPPDNPGIPHSPTCTRNPPGKED